MSVGLLSHFVLITKVLSLHFNSQKKLCRNPSNQEEADKWIKCWQAGGTSSQFKPLA